MLTLLNASAFAATSESQPQGLASLTLDEALAADFGPVCVLHQGNFALKDGQENFCVEMGGHVTAGSRRSLKRIEAPEIKDASRKGGRQFGQPTRDYQYSPPAEPGMFSGGHRLEDPTTKR